MKLWKSMLFAAALALPFGVFGGETVAIDENDAVTAAVEVDGQLPENYHCCWIYMNGRWWCVSCG